MGYRSVTISICVDTVTDDILSLLSAGYGAR